jgi:tetratricopeptide (TPR) repeat protein
LERFEEAAADFDRAAELDPRSLGDKVAKDYTSGPLKLRNLPKAIGILRKTVEAYREHIQEHITKQSEPRVLRSPIPLTRRASTPSA